ncbi:MAG: hypothetical protein ACJAYK_001949 [Crocinitomicaceae bacterium]|jgi:uncharacterized protein (DUF934 family)
MQKLINQTSEIENTWTLIRDEAGDLSQANIMIPASYWVANQAEFEGRNDVAIWFAGDVNISDFDGKLDQFPVVGVDFPAFADGRGYSIAHLIIERQNYQGELRAIGDVLIDQLYFMKRCGFNTYLLTDELEPKVAIQYFETFSEPYQLAVDIKDPIFRRKA